MREREEDEGEERLGGEEDKTVKIFSRRASERGPRVLSLLSSLSSSPCSRLAGLLLSHRAFVRSFVHVSPYL